MEILHELVALGAIPATAWAVVHVVRDVLRYKIQKAILRKIPGDSRVLNQDPDNKG